MLNSDLAWFWFIAGIIFVVSEIFIPGLIVIFLGFSALTVAYFIKYDFFNNWVEISFAWIILSCVYTLLFRQLFARLMPGNTSKSNIDEDNDAIGTEVLVTQEINTENDLGRIFFRGSTWNARGLEKALKEGEKAVLVAREGNTWLVK